MFTNIIGGNTSTTLSHVKSSAPHTYPHTCTNLTQRLTRTQSHTQTHNCKDLLKQKGPRSRRKGLHPAPHLGSWLSNLGPLGFLYSLPPSATCVVCVPSVHLPTSGPQMDPRVAQQQVGTSLQKRGVGGCSCLLGSGKWSP